LSGIFFLMVMYTLYFAASLMIPIVLAFLLSLVFAPLVRFMTGLHIPHALGALLVMLSVAAAMGGGVYAVMAPAAEWMEKAPTELRRLESKLAWVKKPIEQLNEARRKVDEFTDMDEGSGDTQDTNRRQPSFSLVETVLSRTPSLIFGIFVFLILLFFILASGDTFLNKMVQSTPRLRDKKRVVETVRDIQLHVSTYLATISFINLAVGATVALTMYLLGMPNPILWGAIAGVLNYIPYLGVAISIVIVGFVSLLTFESPGQILLPPAALLLINIVEGQIVTPIVAGRRLSLSPVAVFLAIVVLGWIWGIVGVLVAVPVLATVKLACERIEPLERIATFLSHQQAVTGRSVKRSAPP
jgi:predicted PurR-regulated permease PerM